MSSSVEDLFSQVQAGQQGPPNYFGPQFDYTKAIQGEGIPPLQLPDSGPNSGPLQPFRQPVMNDPSGGQVHRLPAQMAELFGQQQAQNLAIGPRFPGGDVRINPNDPRRNPGDVWRDAYAKRRSSVF